MLVRLRGVVQIDEISVQNACAQYIWESRAPCWLQELQQQQTGNAASYSAQSGSADDAWVAEVLQQVGRINISRAEFLNIVDT